MRVNLRAYVGASILAVLMLGSVPVPSVQAPGSELMEGTLAVKELVIAMASDIETMDPAKTAIMNGPPGMVYETLIQRDLTGAYVPGLAEWWSMNRSDPDDPKFDMRLKQGVTFHDGLTFDTYALKRILNYLTQNDSWVQYQFWAMYACQNKTGWPDAAIWCKDSYNVSLNLTWADASLVFNLSNLYSSMMSPDALEADGYSDYGTPGHLVVGTGPFILQEWVAGDHVTLVKNPNYTWGASWYVNKGPANIDKINYRIIADQATRLAGFEAGIIDILQEVPAQKLPAYSSDPALEVVSGPGQGLYYVEFNCQRSPWTSVELRRAFGWAINRTPILNTVWHGYGEEGVNYLPPVDAASRMIPSWYNFTFDPAMSEYLFMLAGYTDVDGDGWLENASGELVLRLWTTDRAEDIQMSEMIKLQFEQAGVHVQLTAYATSELLTRASAGLQDAILFWYSWPRADILDWHFGTWAMGGSNTAWFSDPVFDQYVENWIYAETESQFYDNATAGHLQLLLQGPWAPVLFWHQLDAIHNKVVGWYVHPLGREQVFNILDVDLATNPTAVASASPNPALAGETVTFDGSGSADDVGIVNYTWTFMDGGTLVELWGMTVMYEFANEFQTVGVNLTVTDGDGNNDTDSITLEVLGAIPELPTILVPTIGIVAIVAMLESAKRNRLRQ